MRASFCSPEYSLPSKIEELRKVAKDTNSAVIGLSKTKLDKTVLGSEISIPNYSLKREDWNRKDEGVVCYIRSDICFNSQNYLSDKIENIFLTCYSQKQSLILLSLYTNFQLKITFWTTYQRDSMILI